MIVSFTPQDERQCSNCRFFCSEERECRRYAPRASAEHPVWWADVKEVDWCGEWEQREGAS